MWKNMIRSIATLALALMLPLSATAQSVDDWKWSATLYGWFPAISGKTSFPATGTGPNIDIDADTILDAIEFVFMGSLEAQRGRYGIFTDVIYLDVEGDKSATRDVTISRLAIPVGVDLNANLEIKSWLWTIAGTYGVIATPEHSMQVLAGARLIDLEAKLNWQFNGNIGALPLAATGSSTVDRVVLGCNYRRQRETVVRCRPQVVRAVLPRYRHRRIELHLAGHRRDRL